MARSNVRVTVQGLNAVRGRMVLLAKNFDSRVQAALMEEMEIERHEIIQRIPKDTRALSESTELIAGPRKGVPNKKGQIAATILVGNDTVNPKTGMMTKEYAVKVHEDLEAFHNEGQAKYLESVLRESGPHMLDRVMRRVGKLD